MIVVTDAESCLKLGRVRTLEIRCKGFAWVMYVNQTAYWHLFPFTPVNVSHPSSKLFLYEDCYQTKQAQFIATLWHKNSLQRCCKQKLEIMVLTPDRLTTCIVAVNLTAAQFLGQGLAARSTTQKPVYRGNI